MNSSELIARAGISYRQLDYWTTTGLIHPKAYGGSGNYREFNDIEARIVLYMADLVRTGLKPASAAEMARDIAATGMTKRGQFVIVAAQAGIEAPA